MGRSHTGKAPREQAKRRVHDNETLRLYAETLGQYDATLGQEDKPLGQPVELLDQQNTTREHGVETLGQQHMTLGP